MNAPITLAEARRNRPSEAFFMRQAILSAAAEHLPITLRQLGLKHTVGVLMEMMPKAFPKAVRREYRKVVAPYRRISA